jgi:hypothetical protein
MTVSADSHRESIVDPSTRPSSNPYVFMVGCPRSGTTLLQRLVDAHPQIAITPETHWIASCFKDRTGLTPEGSVTPELIAFLTNHRNFLKLGVDRRELERLLDSGGPVPYARFVSAIFDLYGSAQGKRLVGDKTPGYARNLPTLHALWPQAKFVHLIRDGRDTCLSAINWKRKVPKLQIQFPSWSEDPVTTASMWWKWHVRLARQAGQSLGQQLYYEIRYEALVADAAGECARLCAFLDLPYDEAMLRFHEGRATGKPDRDAKHAWMPITQGLRDWRRQMPAEDVERFEAAAGDLLEELGYVRACPHPRAEVRAQVERIHDVFPKDSYFQVASLPTP